jgi:hypothetical protein
MEHDDTDIVTSIWAPAPTSEVTIDEDCSPTKVCRNMQGITFDGYAPEGADLRTAWRDLLAREGKLNTSGGSIRDLVLGPDARD